MQSMKICSRLGTLSLLLSWSLVPESPPQLDIASLSTEEELAKFLKLPLQKESPLVYWSTSKDFPHLKSAAKRAFTASGSTADIERVFNFCGNILSERRERTTDENFENLIMCKINSFMVD